MKTKNILVLLLCVSLIAAGPFVYAQGAAESSAETADDSSAKSQTRVQRIRAKLARLQAEYAAQQKAEKTAATLSKTEKSVAVADGTFETASNTVKSQLENSMGELANLRKAIAEEKIPLNRKLNDLEANLIKIRLDYQQSSRLLDSRTLDLSNLRSEIKTRKDEAAYLSNLLGEYIRNFESRLHIAELHRYEKPLETAKLAPENGNLSQQEIFKAQATLVTVSIERLNEALGGIRFEGNAVVKSGQVKPGTFVVIGPYSIFLSGDGKDIGTVEQRLGSLEPTVVAFGTPENGEAASLVVTSSSGNIPFDPTLGNAHKVESTKESLVEHIKKGGSIMVPILLLGFAALSVGIYKWFSLRSLRKPSKKRLHALMAAVSRMDKEAALVEAHAIKGPIGKMFVVGIENLDAPIEFIEEVMHEAVLTTRLKLQSLLPFIALSATCGPLLGLLGTVTGIITTFGLITVFGSGDPKTLSGGISEALVGTEYGLYVAIPSLLLHAFLSRRARGFIDQMEKAGISFINQVSKTRLKAIQTPVEMLREEVDGGNGMKKWKR